MYVKNSENYFLTIYRLENLKISKIPNADLVKSLRLVGVKNSFNPHPPTGKRKIKSILYGEKKKQVDKIISYMKN